VAADQHGPRIHQRGIRKPFHCHTQTVTSALKVAYLQTYRTDHRSLYRRGPIGRPSIVLNLLLSNRSRRCLEWSDKSWIQNNYYNRVYGVTAEAGEGGHSGLSDSFSNARSGKTCIDRCRSLVTRCITYSKVYSPSATKASIFEKTYLGKLIMLQSRIYSGDMRLLHDKRRSKQMHIYLMRST
jgi:hypothetical protein